MNGQTLYINGRIDVSVADGVLATDFSQINRVVIDSPGGNATQAFKIADRLSAAGVKLQVRGRCMSACASILLPASRIREVIEGSTIAFHGTQYGLYRLYERTKARDGHQLTQSPIVKQLAEREYALFVKAGIDPRLLVAPYAERGTVCYLEAVQPDGTKRFTLGTESAVFVTTVGTLAMYGMAVRTVGADGESPVRDPSRLTSSITPEDVQTRFDNLDVQPCPGP